MARDGKPDPAPGFVQLARDLCLRRFAVACVDLAGGHDVCLHADEPFHPASTVKLAIMAEAYLAAADGRVHLEDLLMVANLFRSLADGRIYALDPDDDSDPGFYATVGSLCSIDDLLEHMIVRGSNLAANVLLEHLGAEQVSTSMADLGAPGIVVRRGLQDLRAHALGMNNTATARALRTLLLRLARGEVASPAASHAMVGLMLREPSRVGVRALLPADVLVAHKSGWTEAVAHDAGIVLPAVAEPYVLVVLTEGFADIQSAWRFVAEVSRQVHVAF